VCDCSDQAAHYHNLGPQLGASLLTRHIGWKQKQKESKKKKKKKESIITQVFDTLWEIVEHFYASKVDSILI
jgi:Zn-finger nucleic acid-binding protein